MKRKTDFLLIFASIVVIVSIPLFYGSVYTRFKEFTIRRAFVSGKVIGVSPSYVSGMVVKMYVKEGDSVKKGQMIALIDDTLYKAEVEKKQSKLNSMLFELERLDNMTNSYAYSSLKDEIEVLKKDVKLSQLMLSYTRIVSPIDGVVAKDAVHVGDSVSPSSVVVYLYKPSTIYVRAFVDVENAKYLKIGKTVILKDVATKAKSEGKIEKLGGIDVFSICNNGRYMPVSISLKSKKGFNFSDPVLVIVKR
ncbi:HlyD family efflux transporter periplasmic adaptor subunit [Hippea maritima]|uniref:Secretion protein HlyD family protein n=1 Tax=Hippea maritima (strain ATCC 700847 / DSM 10411 / MH2) TaxID=760142 RepID=F2LUT4_HIPMA|nr:HlyD family efflux transporter periplasmic adaptor subunit [Hippea maritima]AEA33539.1 secretion protein HlyD family protein [Hippea maritima DSM 10411]